MQSTYNVPPKITAVTDRHMDREAMSPSTHGQHCPRATNDRTKQRPWVRDPGRDLGSETLASLSTQLQGMAIL